MPIQTDTSVSPYFDDYSENNDYYKVLFRPGVSVQTRELNQLQTILQKQIERFGDNIFKRGTIVDGCDITFHDRFPYVKIKDTSTDRQLLNVSEFYGYYVKNQANVTPLVGAIQTVIGGFESRSPDLNTLYIRYVNSGTSNNGVSNVEEAVFSANQILTIYNPRNIIESVTSLADSSGFSNNDTVVILPSIAVQNTTGGKTLTGGTFQVGNYITDGTANSVIVEVDTLSNTEATLLRIKPVPTDLRTGNTDMWSFSVDTRIVSSSNSTQQANVVGIVGSGAAALLTTGALGEVDHISVTAKGTGYYVLPTVTIASTTADVGQIAAVDLLPQNYLTKVSVANNAYSPIGLGYAVTVGAGVVYQKGFFSRVSEHLVVVEKYANTPNAKAVGFDTTEAIINSNQDPKLLDNATGAANETAPGADRLKLTPTLVVLTTDEVEANTDFFPIAEFSDGNPYKQNRQTQYNIIGNEIARRTYEESGNYVLDSFIMNTKSANSFANESTNFNIRIDPGLAYINGKRVETTANFDAPVRKGTTSIIANTASISLNYGSYIQVNQMGGTFVFKNGDIIQLYGAQASTGAKYISLYPGITPAASQINIPAGTPNSGLIGTARIRSIILEDGIPGTPEAVYRVYLFDIRVATARNFSVVKSIFYNGATKGIADVVLESGECVLKDNTSSTLLYYAGKDAVKTANTISYIYKTYDTNRTLVAATGTITIDTIAPETYPYFGQLSSAQEGEVLIVPLANVQFTNSIAGSITTNPATNQVNGTSTVFTSTFQAGDFIRLANSTSNSVVQINNIANDTVLYVKANSSIGFSTANAFIYFPQYVPISLKQRSTRTAIVDSESNTMVISLGAAVNSSTTMAVSYNVKSGNTVPLAKTATRNKFVRLRLANNLSTNTGPWAVGVTDVFRLRGVYVGSNSTFASTDAGITDVTNDYYIDHNQNENYYNTSYLYKRPGTTSAITTSQFLLVKFDYFVHEAAGGLKGPGLSGTYSINDSVELSAATSTIHTLEIPEVHGTQGAYYDLRDHFDIRPTATNTVTPSSTAVTAPINPEEPSDATRFDAAANMKFPSPDSVLQATIEHYQGRQDRVVIDETGRFRVLEGESGTNVAPVEPDNSLTINIINIPPYPSVPYSISAQTVAYVDTSIANEKYASGRLNKYRVITPITASQRSRLQPRGYTMEAIGTLEKRIADLEYYTTLNIVESQVQRRNIPSSSNSSIDRAKFGFFVDSFSDWSYSEISNPGYHAAVIGGRLSPAVTQICLPTSPVQPHVALPFVEATLVSQLNSTNGPVYVAPPVVPTATGPTSTTSTGPINPTPTTNTAVNPTSGTVTVTPTVQDYDGTITVANNVDVVAQTSVNVIQKNRTTSRSDNVPYVYEDFEYVMSATTGLAELYMISRDNYVAIEIFQGLTTSTYTTKLTSATASAITSADATAKGLNYLGQGIEHKGTLERKSFGPLGRWVEDQLKMTWTHVPSAGRYYKIRVYKGKHHGGAFGGQGASGTFVYKLIYPADSVVQRSTSLASTTNFNQNYAGLIHLPFNNTSGLAVPIMQMLSGVTGMPTAGGRGPVSLSINGLSSGFMGAPASMVPFSTLSSPASYLASEQSIELTVHGLKPSTTHIFQLDGETLTTSTGNKVKQVGKQIGDPLVSNGSGDIDLVLYIGTGVNPVTSVQQAAGAVTLTANRRSTYMTNADGSSEARGTIEIPGYTAPATVTTPASTSNTSGGNGFWTVLHRLTSWLPSRNIT